MDRQWFLRRLRKSKPRFYLVMGHLFEQTDIFFRITRIWDKLLQVQPLGTNSLHWGKRQNLQILVPVNFDSNFLHQNRLHSNPTADLFWLREIYLRG
jgi:hypothetical protein